MEIKLVVLRLAMLFADLFGLPQSIVVPCGLLPFPRQSDFFAARYNTVTYGKHSLRHLGPNLWGKLSPDVRKVTTLKCFKNKIRTLDIVTLMDNDASVVISAIHRHICHTVNIVKVINIYFIIFLYTCAYI